MSPLPKIVALTGVVGAALADAGLFVAAALQAAPAPSVESIGVASGAGAATTLAILWFWKGTVDKRLDEKVDKDVVAEMSKSIDRIEGHVTWLVHEKRGE